MSESLANAAALLPFLLAVGLAASTGARYRPGPWYASLAKPAWTPPDWLFGVAWTILYLMIAIAGWIVARQPGSGVALGLWVVQIVINAGWSWLMFGRRRIDLALADVAALWLAVAGFIAAAWPIAPTAAWLFVPYLLWATYAGALNFAVWRLNPAQRTA